MATVERHWIWDRIESSSWIERGIVLLIVVAVVALAPVFGDGYQLQVLYTIFLFTTIALGWNILSGFTGYIDFGYAGFIGIGAYATVLPIVKLGAPWYLGLASGIVITAILGSLIGYPALRLTGAYFAIAMLAVAVALRAAMASQYLAPITQGATGVSFFPPLSRAQAFYIMGSGAIIAALLNLRIATSPYGLRLLTIREDETLANSLGINTVRDKMIAMAIHTGIAGFCGGMLAFNLSYIDPASVFAIEYTEYPIVMVLFGGLGTAAGPIIGGVVIGILREVLWGQFPTLHLAILGMTIVALILFLPEGVIEWLKERGTLPRRRWL